ncbi:hypothetical protein, partial [Glaesserella parasuis]|uniref:hypothetical protein n=1 Tax=Glaesserella parasuis TaxID=738 RepID=UPI002436CB71
FVNHSVSMVNEKSPNNFAVVWGLFFAIKKPQAFLLRAVKSFRFLSLIRVASIAGMYYFSRTTSITF